MTPFTLCTGIKLLFLGTGGEVFLNSFTICTTSTFQLYYALSLQDP